MTTLRQAEANRRNSRLSTGPRTEAGKLASRANALRDGFSGPGALPAERADDVAARVACFHTGLHAADDYDRWLILQAATESVRLDGIRHREAALRHKTARRAVLCWDDDRGVQAAELATRLARDPEATVGRLRQTPQGGALLAGRWEALGRILEAHGGWDEAQRSLALDLLGVPAVLRGAGLTELDGAAGAEARAAAVAGRELARLAEPERVAGLSELDELERSQAERGLDAGESREARLLARYEAGAARRLAWALGALKQREADRARRYEEGRRVAMEVLWRKEQRRRAAAPAARPADVLAAAAAEGSSFVAVSAAPAPAPAAEVSPPPSGSAAAPLSARATLAEAFSIRDGAAAVARLLAPAPGVDGAEAPRKPMSAKQRRAWDKNHNRRKRRAAASR